MCDLLGTIEGIKVVARFLAESGAFTKTRTPMQEVGMLLWEDEPEPHEEEEIDHSITVLPGFPYFFISFFHYLFYLFPLLL